MKCISITALAVAAVMCCTSCYKQNTVSSSDTSNAGSNNGGSGNGSFNWTGVAPLSVKADGVLYVFANGELDELGGDYAFGGESTDDGTTLTLLVPVDALPGQVYNMPFPLSATWTTYNPEVIRASTAGKIKVVTNNSSTLEGYFWTDMKDYNQPAGPVVHLTEGYFKFSKP